MARTFLLIPLLMFVLFGCAPPVKQMETRFYPELPIEPRMQFLKTISNEGDIGKTTSGMRAFVAGEDALRGVNRPYAIASRPGYLYVSDVSLNMVIVIDFAKKEFRPLPTERATALRQPRGLTVVDGVLYVADNLRRQVLVFDSEDKFLRLYGGVETLEQPLDVAVYGDRVYVVDHSAYNIKVFDRETGALLSTIGERGREEGQLDRPTHVRVDQEGNLYVTDSLNFRVQKFDAEGNFLHLFGYAGATPGGFARPKGIDISPDGFLYAVDAAFENVQIFHDPSQFLVFFFGGFGHAPSFMYLPSPLTISTDNLDQFQRYVDKDFKVDFLVYVGNQLGDYKINVYGVGKWIGTPLN